MRSAIRQILFGQSDKLSFDLPLVTSLVPRLALGSNAHTFTRATTATVTDFEGLVKTVKSGEARFEGARRVENLLTYSEDFSNAAWVKTGVTVTPNAVIAPDGSLTADTISGFDTAADRADNSSGFIPTSKKLQYSLWMKGVGTIHLGMPSNLSYDSAPLTLSSSWRRYSMAVTYLATDITAVSARIIFRAGDTASSIDVWGAQLEDVTGQANQNPSEYISTNVLSAPYHGAGVDGVKYFPYRNGNTVASNVVTEAQGPAIPDATLKGYLAEGARTNLLLQSATPATQDVTVTAQAYTISMWGTGTCTLSGTGLGVLTGTGANDRVQLTFTPTAGTLTLTFVGTNTKGQLEAGAFASSYIPTTTASVTRNADALSYSAINNINPLAISKYVEFSVLTANATFIININDGTENNRDSFYPGFNTGYPTFNVLSDGIAQASITVASPYNNGVMHKIASSAENNKFLFFGDGNQIGSIDTAGVMPMNLTTINIGKSSVANSQLFGTIKNIKIWKNALKNTKLMRLTQ